MSTPHPTPSTHPTAPPTHPTAPPTHPTAPPTHPTVPPTHPTAPPTHPTVPPTHPTAPPTQPVAPPAHAGGSTTSGTTAGHTTAPSGTTTAPPHTTTASLDHVPVRPPSPNTTSQWKKPADGSPATPWDELWLPANNRPTFDPYEATQEVKDMAAAKSLKTIRAVMLRPTPNFVANPKDRFQEVIGKMVGIKKMPGLVGELVAARNLLSTATTPDAKNVAEVKVKAAEKALKDHGDKFVEDARKNVTDWVNAIFEGLEQKDLIGPGTKTILKPTTGGTPTEFANNTLLVIMTPEFAFNGRDNAGNAGTDAFDAKFPFFQGVEALITTLVHQKLQEYPQYRILFAFSCCTYGNTLWKDVRLGIDPTNDKDYDVSGVKDKLAAYSRITILTSTPMPPVMITKYKPADVDGWTGQLTATNLWDHTELGTKARLNETTLALSCFGDDVSSVGFGTCLDVTQDITHGTANFCVYLGGGLPWRDTKDAEHGFMLNDTYSWKPIVAPSDPAYLTEARNMGYYAVYKDVLAIGATDAQKAVTSDKHQMKTWELVDWTHPTVKTASFKVLSSLTFPKKP